MAVRTIFNREEEKRKLRQTLEQKKCVTRQLGEMIQSAQGKDTVTVIPERKVPTYRARDDLAIKKQVSLPPICTIVIYYCMCRPFYVHYYDLYA